MITARAAATFEPVGRSVATARAFVRDTLQGWGFSEVVDDAVVLTSELVTNAVVHAGTAADVQCLRFDSAVRIEVSDRYPERELPLHDAKKQIHPDHEGGRGLLLCSALASRWGVEYTAANKHVWFRLDLPQRPAGTRSAGPALPVQALPLADERVRVAVVQVDRGGVITRWNQDAAELFGHPGDQVTGKPLGDFAAWPQTPAPATASPRPFGCPAGRAATASATPTGGSSPSTARTCGSATPRASRPPCACWCARTSAPSCRTPAAA